MSPTATTVRAGEREVTISHPDKLLFQTPRISKLALARYYARIAPAMLPHVRDRPLALQAFPDGIDATGYFMKSVPRYFPEWIATATVPKRGGSLTQVLGQRTPRRWSTSPARTSITPHVWLSRADQAPQRPIG